MGPQAERWDLNGKKAVITGAASGFGRELALLCKAAGMRLVLADVDLAGLEQTLALTDLTPDRAVVQRCDVSKPEDVDQLALTALQRFGGTHLLFNNAGVIAAGPIWKATPQDWAWCSASTSMASPTASAVSCRRCWRVASRRGWSTRPRWRGSCARRTWRSTAPASMRWWRCRSVCTTNWRRPASQPRLTLRSKLQPRPGEPCPCPTL